MSSLTKRLVVLAAGVAVMLVGVLYHYPAGRTRGLGGRHCQVSVGQARTDVLRQCGEPDAAGGQPKRAGSGPQLINFCSAPCDRYGDRLVFYDCATKVAEVEALTAEYQGCVGVQRR